MTNKSFDLSTLTPTLDSPHAAPLKEWLLSPRVNARCLWQVMATTKNPRTLEGWAINGRVVIILIASYGWEIYTQGDSNDVTVTLAEAQMRLGITFPPLRNA